MHACVAPHACVQDGGLSDLFTMVMAGLVATTPHMISCSVMALARLLFEYGGRSQPLLEQLLPPVLSLLRTKSREVVKAVLGFVKVCASRLPVDALRPRLPAILEGLLMWCDDSKNKFKLKVRVIVERLARRAGFDAMAAAMPPGDMRLLSHIRKEHTRKQKRRDASRAGSEVRGRAWLEARGAAHGRRACLVHGAGHAVCVSCESAYRR